MDAHCLGVPSQDGFFFFLRFGCVLDEMHGTIYSEVVREVLKEGQEL